MANRLHGRSRGRRVVVGLAAGVALLALAVWLAFQLSPWPSVLLVRQAFGQGSEQASAALQKHVPAGVREWRDLRYDSADPDGFIDVYAPADARGPLPTVLWIHGGAFISGDKADVANYARILAAQGFVVASVQYTLAPEARYPTPLRQVNRALGWLAGAPDGLPVDPSRLVLAGDSAGAQLAAQLAAALSEPGYAKRIGLVPSLPPGQLAGTLLFCGPFDARLVAGEGAFGDFLATVFWSYFGERDFARVPAAAEFSVPAHVTPAFPPSFISAGNADPLLLHSEALAAALAQQGVRVDTLFFPADHSPALGHEYQFDLDGEAGREALARSVAFLRSLGTGDAAAPPAISSPGASPASARAGSGRSGASASR